MSHNSFEVWYYLCFVAFLGTATSDLVGHPHHRIHSQNGSVSALALSLFVQIVGFSFEHAHLQWVARQVNRLPRAACFGGECGLDGFPSQG